MDKIPIFDLICVTGTNYEKNKEKWISAGTEIRKILGRYGFMQIINHGIPEELIDSVFLKNKSFFELPIETKMKYGKPKSIEMDSYYGYTKAGEEHFAKGPEFRETYDWIEGRGIYPDEIIPNFSSSVEMLHEHCKIVAKNILQLFASGLGLEDVDYFVKKNGHWTNPKDLMGLTNIRLAHYPEIPRDVKVPPGSVRIGEHTDFITLTLLFQDSAGGLEVKNTKGEWIECVPVPGAIVVNTGDLLEYWTSGIFPATPHRVEIPESLEKREIPRYSIAYFCGPDTTEVVTPLEIQKTPEEENRIEKNGKAYSSEPVIAYEHVFRKAKAAYYKP